MYTYASFVLIALAVEGMWHDQDWSCHWYIWVVANVIPLWVYVSTFRAWRLYYNHFASQYFMRNVGVLDEVHIPLPLGLTGREELECLGPSLPFHAHQKLRSLSAPRHFPW